MRIGPKTQLVWHGLSQSVIAAGGAVVLLTMWPTPWQWVIIGVTGVLACIKGIDALLSQRVE
jgi:hypothetical protein